MSDELHDVVRAALLVAAQTFRWDAEGKLPGQFFDYAADEIVEKIDIRFEVRR